jgi:hypothetical protein
MRCCVPSEEREQSGVQGRVCPTQPSSKSTAHWQEHSVSSSPGADHRDPIVTRVALEGFFEIRVECCEVGGTGSNDDCAVSPRWQKIGQRDIVVQCSPPFAEAPAAITL